MSFWVYLVIQVVAAIVEYELTPVPKGPAAQKANKPTVSQGTPRRIVFGDVWIHDPMVCFWGNQRQTPIKAGGK